MRLEFVRSGKAPNEMYRVRLLPENANRASFIGYIVHTSATDEKKWGSAIKYPVGAVPSIFTGDSYEQVEGKIRKYIRKILRDNNMAELRD